jgi:hypothetical protein
VAYERYVESDPKAQSVEWLRAAAMHAFAVSEGVGEFANYQRVCQSMIDRFASSGELAALEQTVKSCSILATAASVDRAAVAKIAAALEDGDIDSKDVSWHQTALALDAYRRGDFVAAQEWADKGFANAADDIQRMWAKTVSSLAFAASGDLEQAALALNFAKGEAEKRIERNADGSISGDSLFRAPAFDHNLLIAEILIREASAALGM